MASAAQAALDSLNLVAETSASNVIEVVKAMLIVVKNIVGKAEETAASLAAADERIMSRFTMTEKREVELDKRINMIKDQLEVQKS